MPGAGLNRINLMPAPGSSAASLDVNIIYSDGPFSGTNAVRITTAGEFILEVNSVGGWSIALEF
jgi:hypothetical protein